MKGGENFSPSSKGHGLSRQTLPPTAQQSGISRLWKAIFSSMAVTVAVSPKRFSSDTTTILLPLAFDIARGWERSSLARYRKLKSRNFQSSHRIPGVFESSHAVLEHVSVEIGCLDCLPPSRTLFMSVSLRTSPSRRVRLLRTNTSVVILRSECIRNYRIIPENWEAVDTREALSSQ